MRSWRHVTKLDPDRPLSDEALNLVLSSGTDAILVGGTQGITGAKVRALLARLARAPLPVALEVTTPEAVQPGADLYLVPTVVNTPNGYWQTGAQAEALGGLLSPFIRWDGLHPLPYLILNPESAAAQLTGAVVPGPEQLAGYAALVGRLWRWPSLYVEYSGTLGDPELVGSLRQLAGPNCQLIYGGGIKNAQDAARMAAVADTIVVGNLVYEEPTKLRETVEGPRR